MSLSRLGKGGSRNLKKNDLVIHAPHLLFCVFYKQGEGGERQPLPLARKKKRKTHKQVFNPVCASFLQIWARKKQRTQLFAAFTSTCPKGSRAAAKGQREKYGFSVYKKKKKGRGAYLPAPRKKMAYGWISCAASSSLFLRLIKIMLNATQAAREQSSKESQKPPFPASPVCGIFVVLSGFIQPMPPAAVTPFSRSFFHRNGAA